MFTFMRPSAGIINYAELERIVQIEYDKESHRKNASRSSAETRENNQQENGHSSLEAVV